MFEGAPLIVLGLGISGQSAARYYLRHKSRVIGVDNNTAVAENRAVQELQHKGMELRVGPDDVEWLSEAEALIASPGINPTHPLVAEAVRKGMPVFTELELGLLRINKPTIGITGTNGKTTTTTLVARVLEATGKKVFTGGNIGRPILEAEPEDCDLVVCEISSFQLHYLNRHRFHAGILLNIAPNHIDWHLTMWEYERAKLRIFENQTADDVAVVNAEENWASLVEGLTPARVLRFGEGGKGQNYARLEGDELWLGEAMLMKRSEVPLKGRMNVLNVLAAAAATEFVGASLETIRRTVAEFQGLPHRLEFIGVINGREVYNDSKSTTPHATVSALEALRDGKPITLILGGSEKNLSFEPVVNMAQETCFAVVVTGQIGPRIFESFLVTGSERPLVVKTARFKDAVEWAMAITPPGGRVLLSPACASFDEFENYAQRGEVFKELAYEVARG